MYNSWDKYVFTQLINLVSFHWWFPNNEKVYFMLCDPKNDLNMMENLWIPSPWLCNWRLWLKG